VPADTDDDEDDALDAAVYRQTLLPWLLTP
jgi:hypothetical protein